MKISTLILIVVILFTIYKSAYLFFKKILHRDYRWEQKDNVCYDEAREFSYIATIIVVVVTIILYIFLTNNLLILK